VLFAASKGMWAVKLYTINILQFLTGGAGWQMLTCIVAGGCCVVVLILDENLLGESGTGLQGPDIHPVTQPSVSKRGRILLFLLCLF